MHDLMSHVKQKAGVKQFLNLLSNIAEALNLQISSQQDGF